MKPKTSMIWKWGALLLAASAVLAFSRPADNEYAYWSRFKAGTFVSFICVTASAGAAQESIKTLTLKEVVPTVRSWNSGNRRPPGGGNRP